MSIWASLPAPQEHPEWCAIWRESPTDAVGVAPAACSCGHIDSPITYWGSATLPWANLERAGHVDIAETTMPGGRIAPYLRFGVNGGTVVLEPAHVRQIVETLTGWLDRLDEEA